MGAQLDDQRAQARPILAASIAVFREGRVLIARRGRAPNAGLYSLPGGAIEAGETAREAALRELREEVGVEAEIVAVIEPVALGPYLIAALRRPLAARRSAPRPRGERHRLDRSRRDRRLSDDARPGGDRRQGGGARAGREVMRFAPLVALAAALSLAAGPLGAQTAAPVKPAAAPAPAKASAAPAATPTPAPIDTPPPYEPQLLRLAEIIGALAYLRDLCGDGDGDAFRAKFTSLVETEGDTEARKDALAGAFNRGFRDYELTYRACTPTARDIVTRFLDEAGHIARDVANRYAG